MLKIFLILLLITSILESKVVDYKITPSNLKSQSHMNIKIKILDAKELKFPKKNGIEFSEISDLAYKDFRLFALSDRGFLYRLSVDLSHGKIDNLTLVNSMSLKDKKRSASDKEYKDSEGMAFFENDLLISFEKKHRVDLYDLNAKKIDSVKINKSLENLSKYVSANKGLESVAYNEKYGVITAPEVPLINKNSKFHTIYSKDKTWSFKADGSISGLEFINKNEVLALLRQESFLALRRVTTLVVVNLNDCKNGKCKSEVVANMDSSDGWRLDNFEGLTKVGKNRFLIISDDNGSFFQKTLLVLFEIVK